jgi:preprotein translocase subunit SecA
MLKGLLSKVVGDPNEREIRKLEPLVEAINGQEPDMERRTDAEFRAMTDRFRARLRAGETLDDLVVEAFAAVREVAKRTVDMRPFDVQLIGGIALHQGMVAEMRTGEGKTLVATMPIYVNALLGRGVHLVTVNDYLARRDVLWMGPIYDMMGLSVGLLQSGSDQPAYLYDPNYERDPYPGLRPVPRQEAYAAEVTYGTNNEFGFDYLRDNLALTLERRVQRPLYYGIVDEVDNIFVDEARTPLIISGPSGEPVEEYNRFATIARRLEPGVHFELDEKERSVYLSDEGLAIVEQETGIENIYDEANYRYVHYMQQALKAHVLFMEGRDYIRQRKRIILIDQHTGRLMPNRRLSEGLHQAIEAKEGVPIRPRDVTSATITIQNYFRMYEKLAGMSGTAVTEAEEFFKIYKLEVLAIPTNKPVIREDHADVVYRSGEAKLRAVAREILACHSRGQPVLVGTTSVEMSERLSTRLTGDRLQMAAMAPRAAYALQDAELDREGRASLRETMNASLETMNSAAWRRMMRTLNLDHNMVSTESLQWLVDYLDLPEDLDVRRTMERALREGIPHEILNAKEHTREATIIARAGEPGAVTIATNMAGRGVDIKLGGELTDETIHRAHQTLKARGLDPFAATPAQMDSAIVEVIPQYAKRRDKVLAVGGLHILGTERHEARRIDNQLRGRSGRQGEPGSSRFYLSLEDDLMRRFGRRDMLSKLMEQIGDDFPIEHNLVSRTIERAQTAVEGHNFDIRKHLLEYDDVLSRQRETIYDERLNILKSADLQAEVWRMLEGQADEYLEKYGTPRLATGEDAEQHLLFAGLDDVVPLILPSPSAPFQGPLAFGSHLTAFPPFTISFLADQLADQPLDVVQQTLQDLPRRAAVRYGEQIRQTVSDIARDILDKYEERLDRYRALLDEKIEDFLQLLEERGQPLDPRRLVQQLERTYPLKLSTPPELYSASLDDLRDHWLAQVEAEFHRQTCIGLIERIQIRLPADALRGLDRVRPARIPPAKLDDELRRVLELAAKESGDRNTRQQPALPADPTPDQVLAFISSVKAASSLDFGRLDRLVGHVLGVHLDDLLARYQEAIDEDETRLRRSLERLRGTVDEGKQGGRSDLLGVLRQLNDLVHLEIPDLEALLTQAVAHEYDKWAQRQLAEIQADAQRASLPDTHWSSIAEHLLTSHYTQKQAYDRDHRRRTTWAPRLPFSLLAQTWVEDMDPDALRTAVLNSLRWATEQREQVWGKEELQRWGRLSLDELDEDTYIGLVRYLGKQELGDHRALRVEDLAPDRYEHLRFILALRRLEGQRLGDLPHADELLAQLGQTVESNIVDTPIGELDAGSQEIVGDHLRQTGLLDDAAARAKLVEQPIRDWDRRTREEVAAFWGRQLVGTHKDRSVTNLPPQLRETAISYLQSQRRFVDEERMQRFLVHEGLNDLPSETRQAALLNVAQNRLERLSRRKVSNLDVATRQVVTTSLQRLGLFADHSRRKELLARPLAALEPEVRNGFGTFLARQQLGAERSLRDLDDATREHVIGQLKRTDLLGDPERIEELPHQRLGEVDKAIAERVREELEGQLRAELASKTMEQLPAETRRSVRQALDERDYFVDREKASWYERKTLAQLPIDTIHGLEAYAGRLRLAEVADVPFRELPSQTKGVLLTFFDDEGLLADRAERLRLTQTGSLAQLSAPDRDAVARHLGRNWFVQIRDRRPPDLDEGDRQIVWIYLREQGQFADEFKAELFAYQRLEEFGAETHQAVERALTDRLIRDLDTSPIGDLPRAVRAVIREHLVRADYFVDASRLKQVVQSPAQRLPADVRQAIETALGDHLLASLDTTPIAELPGEIQNELWLYLDRTDYLVDEKKRIQFLDRRLADLGSELYQSLIRDLALHLEAQIGDQAVSELDEDLRQGLREAVEASGYFESGQEREHVLGQPLGSLRREDVEALAVEFGRIRLEAWADQRLSDLPEADRRALLSHLDDRAWFLDRSRFDQLQSQHLRNLALVESAAEPDTIRRDLVEAVRRYQVERLSQRKLVDLDRGQRQIVHQVLLDQGLALEEGQMRPLRHKEVQELEPDTYHALLQDLGSQVVAGWQVSRFQDLSADQQALLGAYLGRQIMSRIERRVLLHTISRLWIDYLTDIEDLRRGIGLEAYGQRDPLVEYKRRAFELFEDLGNNIRRTVVRSLFRQGPEPIAVQGQASRT